MYPWRGRKCSTMQPLTVKGYGLSYHMRCLVAQLCLSLCDPIDYSSLGSSVHGDSPGKNIRMGCHALLQENFPNQGLNPGLLHCRQNLFHLGHQESPQLPQNPSIPLRGVKARQNHNVKRGMRPSIHCISIYRTWKQPKWPSTEQWIKKCGTHKME